MTGKLWILSVALTLSGVLKCAQHEHEKYRTIRTIKSDLITYQKQIAEHEYIQASQITTDKAGFIYSALQIVHSGKKVTTVVIKKPQSWFTWLERSFEYENKNVELEKKSE